MNARKNCNYRFYLQKISAGGRWRDLFPARSLLGNKQIDTNSCKKYHHQERREYDIAQKVQNDRCKFFLNHHGNISFSN
jgi:hypothetical protein